MGGLAASYDKDTISDMLVQANSQNTRNSSPHCVTDVDVADGATVSGCASKDAFDIGRVPPSNSPVNCEATVAVSPPRAYAPDIVETHAKYECSFVMTEETEANRSRCIHRLFSLTPLNVVK